MNELPAELEEKEVHPILHACDVELQQPFLGAYMETDEYRFYVEDGGVCPMSVCVV